ncbi:hypothetical protein Pan216_30950 [Planctomycetes bacterium Pan216]|uniref:DUF1549 domain-containing protein n=1 Tax=Kolteria novifilia TaxID=2527975 RepID=A0A518B5H4_9BACT|nr:hypothetical protein Pan216_30950 [Planctomycetes bacterium Pan216]
MTRQRQLYLSILLAVALVAGWIVLDATAKHPADTWSHERTAAAEIAGLLHVEWEDRSLNPARRVDDLLLARRVSLALVGTVPSLEDIRLIQSWPEETRLRQWTDRLLADRRFADYFAERLARAMVQSREGKPFFVFRRRRFVAWLADQLSQRRPYDELVRDVIASEGLWTDRPAVNYVTGNEQSPNRLASRTVRAFLGLRIDCAECHDHPFADWKQDDFRGLAGFFGNTKVGFFGVRESGTEYRIEDPDEKEGLLVTPSVPYAPELLPSQGRTRERLAAWTTHPDNPYFVKAFVNRVWALLMGKALVEPVDDLESALGNEDVLSALADEFRASGHDLHELIHVIVSLPTFAASSALSEDVTLDQEEAWAAFPMTRLRPEQIAQSLQQIRSLHTVDEESAFVTKFVFWDETRKFVHRYGDVLDEEELTPRGTNLPQRLFLMNGRETDKATEGGLFNGPGRVAILAPDDETAVDIAYLCCLTREPTEAEREHFVEILSDTHDKSRQRAIEDLYWALVNSMEFSWNH